MLTKEKSVSQTLPNKQSNSYSAQTKNKGFMVNLAYRKPIIPKPILMKTDQESSKETQNSVMFSLEFHKRKISDAVFVLASYLQPKHTSYLDQSDQQ
jgi:hypothetical protein